MKEMHFEQEVISHATYLKGVAIRLTYNQEQANDLVQDTIYRALLHREKFHGGNLKAWMTTIMKNLFINSIRTAKRRQKVNNSVNNEYPLDAFTTATTQNLGDASIMMKEVHAEINQLHPDLKTPFMMRYHGFKYDEIAQQLNAPLGTIKSRIHLARKSLIRKLASIYGTTHLSDLAA